MNKIQVKPFSVNDAWRGGRRFKTKEYIQYEKDLQYLLPKLKVPDGKLFLRLEIGVSNNRFDIDNAVKPFVDILQGVYGFNDKQIYLLEVAKEIVPKGEEYISFDISVLE